MGRLYLYGFIEGDKAVSGFPGVDGVGITHTVNCDGLGCVVSEYSGEDLKALPREKLLTSLLAHQKVVERVMLDQPVLPVKFGTILNNSQEVHALLSQRRLDILRALVSIRGKVEVEVAATWDINKMLREVSKDEDIVRAREAIIRKGQPTLEQQIQLGQLVKIRLDQRRESYQEAVLKFLDPFPAHMALNALVSDQMVINVAFLLESAKLQDFLERLHCLDELYHEVITFRVIGPLPPYSFSTVEVTRLTPEQIKGALQLLGLEEATSAVGIRNAYRHLAADEQRLQRPEDKIAAAQFAKLKQASNLLQRYRRANESGEGRVPANEDMFVVTMAGPKGSEVEPTAPAHQVGGWIE